MVEVFDRGVLDRRGFGCSRIENEDIQPIADDAAHLLGERVRAVRSGEVGCNHVGATAGVANFRDDCLGLLRAAAVVNNTCALALARARALARPMPREAPVTSAVFPERSLMSAILLKWISSSRQTRRHPLTQSLALRAVGLGPGLVGYQRGPES